MGLTRLSKDEMAIKTKSGVAYWRAVRGTVLCGCHWRWSAYGPEV